MKIIPESNKELMQICGTRVIHNNKSVIMPITSKTEYNSVDIYSELKSPKIKEKFTWKPMTPEQKASFQHEWYMQSKFSDAVKSNPNVTEKLFELRNKLLEFGGEIAKVDTYEDDLADILTYGQFWLGSNAKSVRGRPSQCHRNACNLWEQNKEMTRICTGYALSADGIWCQHSWLILIKPRSNQIIETTVPRIGYFGFAMNTEQCEDFCSENY